MFITTHNIIMVNKLIMLLMLMIYNAGPQNIYFNVSETGDACFAPDIASDSSGNFIVVWSDLQNYYRAGATENGSAIYAQSYLSDGTPIGHNFRISEPDIKNSRIPSIAMNKSGDFVIAWEANVTDKWGDIDIYARRYNKLGEPLGQSFKVNDDNGTTGQLGAKVVLREDGSFIITWGDRRDGPLYSYAQIYNSYGLLQGNNFKVNTNGIEDVARIGLFEDGKYFFTWSTYLQLYTADGNAEGDIVNIGIDATVKVFSSDSILLSWVDSHQYPYYKVLACFYNIKEKTLGNIFETDDDSLHNPKIIISLAKSAEGEFIIVWQDHRNDFPGVIGTGDIYAQRYDNTGNSIGVNFKVNHEPEERSQRNPVSIFSKSDFITVWLEDQTPLKCPSDSPGMIDLSDDSSSIVCTIQSFENPYPGIVFGWRTIPICPSPGVNYNILSQNFPNPFNQQTTIIYALNEVSNVTLEIYNIRGQKIITLVSELQNSGEYIKKWNGRNDMGNIVSSGIYFYKLKTNKFTQIKKMLLLK